MVNRIELVLRDLGRADAKLTVDTMLSYQADLMSASADELDLEMCTEAGLSRAKVLQLDRVNDGSVPRMVIDKTHQCTNNLLYWLTLRMLHISQSRRAADYTGRKLPKLLQKLIELHRMVRSLCAQHTLEFAVIGGFKIESAYGPVMALPPETRLKLEVNRPMSATFENLLCTMRALLQQNQKELLPHSVEVTIEMVYLVKQHAESNMFANFFTNCTPTALSIILDFQRRGAFELTPALMHLFSQHLINEQSSPIVRIMICEILCNERAFRHFISMPRIGSSVPDLFAQVHRSAFWKFLESLCPTVQSIIASEMAEYLFTRAIKSQLCFSSEKVIAMSVSEWTYASQSFGESLVALTETSAEILTLHAFYEIPLGRIKSIRISNGGVLSLRLICAPTIFRRKGNPKVDGANHPVDTEDYILTITLGKDNITRLKASGFKHWVQTEQQRQSAFKKDYQSKERITIECMPPLPHRNLPNLVAADSKNSPVPRVSVCSSTDLSPMQYQPHDINDFLASYTPASPPQGSQIVRDVAQENTANTELTPELDKSMYPAIDESTITNDSVDLAVKKLPVDEASPVSEALENMQHLDVQIHAPSPPAYDIRNPFETKTDASLVDIGVSKKGTSGPVQSSPIGLFAKADSPSLRTAELDANRKIESLLGQIHATIAGQIDAKRTQSEKMLKDAMRSVSEKISKTRQAAEGRRAELQKATKKNIVEAQERSEALRGKMSAAVRSLNSQMADFDRRLKTSEQLIRSLESDCARGVEEMDRQASVSLSKIEAEVEQKRASFQKKIHQMSAESDPMKIFSAYVAKKAKHG